MPHMLCIRGSWGLTQHRLESQCDGEEHEATRSYSVWSLLCYMVGLTPLVA